MQAEGFNVFTWSRMKGEKWVTYMLEAILKTRRKSEKKDFRCWGKQSRIKLRKKEKKQFVPFAWLAASHTTVSLYFMIFQIAYGLSAEGPPTWSRGPEGPKTYIVLADLKNALRFLWYIPLLDSPCLHAQAPLSSCEAVDQHIQPLHASNCPLGCKVMD